MDKIELEGGKYTLVNDDGRLHALRYGESWRDLAGDGLVLALFHEVERLRDAYLNMRDWAEKNGVNTTAGNADSALRPCRSPYCECDPGKCTHPGCYDARGVPPTAEPDKGEAFRLWMHLHGHDYGVPERIAIAIFDAGWMAHKQAASGVRPVDGDLAGAIAYQLTKRLVIDMPTARAAVDAAIAGVKASDSKPK